MRILFFISLFVYLLNGAYVKEYTWRNGDSFLKFLQKYNIDKSLYFNLDQDDKELVTEIRAGIKYQILYSDDNQIEQILIPINDEIQVHLIQENGEYKFSTDPIYYRNEMRSVLIEIKSSPHQDIINKTHNISLANEFLIAFRRYINFRKEIKRGDRVVILYRQKIRLGKVFGDVKIESAMIERDGKAKYIIRYKDKYYDEKGKLPPIIISKAYRTSFRVPCRYRRISSPFTMKRWHPILHRYRAHLGIDYAAPSGTPIKASAPGRVIYAGWKGGYGRVVEIQHINGYKTLYAHMSRFRKGIRGKRVKQGEIIGYVGSSGRSTGPHLHFGLYHYGKPINPARKIVLVKKKKIKKVPSLLKNKEFRDLLASNMKKINTLMKEYKNENFKYSSICKGEIFNYIVSVDTRETLDNSTNKTYTIAKITNSNREKRNVKIIDRSFEESNIVDIESKKIIIIDDEKENIALNGSSIIEPISNIEERKKDTFSNNLDINNSNDYLTSKEIINQKSEEINRENILIYAEKLGKSLVNL